jgi:hypothetical protein
MVTFLDFGGGDANLYAYVYINPTGLCDPYGLCSLAFFWEIWNGTNHISGAIWAGAPTL